ncbi:MAG: YHS domain-containing protein [Sediminibacterium sp.]|nr:YHS domain-containing protein [Sediminibacterium sp.]
MKYIFYVLVVGFISCNNSNETTKKESNTDNLKKTTITPYSKNMVNNTIDPVCDMNIENAINDTAHYRDKVIGFCSDGCKKDFDNNAAKYIANLK